MQRRARHIFSLAAACSLSVGCASAGGSFAFDPQEVDESNPLVLRAAVQPSDRIDDYVAHRAAPVDVNLDIRGNLASMTPEEFVERLCGEVRNGYFRVFMELNPDLRRRQAMEQRAETMIVPPCLYSARFDNQELRTLGGGEIPDQSTLIGETSGPSLGTVASRPWTSSVSAFSNLYAHARLALLGGVAQLRSERVSAPVTIWPQDSSNAEFLQGLEAVMAYPGEIGLITSRPSGSIATAGATTSGAFECAAGEPFGFSATTLRDVYNFARERAADRRGGPTFGDADLYIVDNGFFGALNVQRPADPWRGSPFPGGLFTPSNTSVIAGKFNGNYPLNFYYDIEPSEVSSHGTFVTGLTLGGPTLRSAVENIFWDGPRPRVQITMLNAAKGDDVVDASTQEALSLNLLPSERHILNMSYRFTTLDNLAGLFRPLVEGGGANQNLLVVAAGNDGKNIDPRNGEAERVYPASLGGTLAPNIITVAAHDGQLQLTDFTNYGSPVDIAAPGCNISSWTDNDGTTRALSGTSVAAPLVTYTAVLLAAMSNDLRPQDLKRRIIASGDLMAPDPQNRSTAYNVRLNVLRSLLAFDDVIELRPESEESAESNLAAAPLTEFIGGDLRVIEGLQCRGNANVARPNSTAAFKPDSAGGYIFWSDNIPPCAAKASAEAHIVFNEFYRVRIPSFADEDGIVEIQRHKEPIMRDYPITSLSGLVMNTRPQSW